VESQNLFLKGILFTASNPLTIIFWSGVFAGQVVEHKFNKKQIILFGTGCVMSTLFFLSSVSALGSIANAFLSQKMIAGMNFIVGVVIIGFGIKILIKKKLNHDN
jgi:threonine/homoserine/homoserine lactone efflux protein